MRQLHLGCKNSAYKRPAAVLVCCHYPPSKHAATAPQTSFTGAAKVAAFELACPSHSFATKPAGGTNKNGTEKVPLFCQ